MRKLWNFCIGILVNDIFYLAPFHFFAVFMKQRTFLFILQCRLAYKTWFSALRIHTDHSTRISIYALWLIFEMFGGHQYRVCFDLS
jgi:hypothetical protein